MSTKPPIETIPDPLNSTSDAKKCPICEERIVQSEEQPANHLSETPHDYHRWNERWTIFTWLLMLVILIPYIIARSSQEFISVVAISFVPLLAVLVYRKSKTKKFRRIWKEEHDMKSPENFQPEK